MRVAAHQPHYLPWLRYIQKIACSDLFILLDDVQFTVNGWQNRNRVKGPHGPICLTVPVRHPFGVVLSAVEIAGDGAWRRKHLRTLHTHYGKSPWYKRQRGLFEDVYDKPWRLLADLSWTLLARILDALGIKTPIIRSSALGIDGRGSDRLAAICRHLGADTYLSGGYATTSHLDWAPFAAAGIQVVVQDWRCPVYTQRYPSQGFAADLSVVDLLLNEGPDSLKILHSGAALRSLEPERVLR
jgi:hypothetical protein